MKDDGDAFAVLGWGLRRYAWVVALCAVAFALGVPRLLDRAPTEYEAQAQVGPTDVLNVPNLDVLPRLGESVFGNGAVARSVRTSVQPALPRAEAVIPDRVELVAAQDNIVFTVIGRGATPRAAERMANIAAQTFTGELNKYAQSVGSFAIQNLADPPAQPVGTISGTTTTGIGILAGLTVGVGLVALILVLRRPVLGARTAEQAAGAPVFGRVVLGRHGDGARGLPQVCRRIRASASDVLLLAGPRNTRRDRRLLSAELSRVLSRAGTDGTGGCPASERLLIVDGPSQADVATRPDSSVVLLVVREGASQTTLRHLAEQYLDGGAAGIVMVHGRSASWRSLGRLLPHRGRRGNEPSTPRRWPSPDGPARSTASDSWAS